MHESLSVARRGQMARREHIRYTAAALFAGSYYCGDSVHTDGVESVLSPRRLGRTYCGVHVGAASWVT